MKPYSVKSSNGAGSGDDGGYYAIKGFLYQFDKALIEILSNPQTQVGIENDQDIDYEKYGDNILDSVGISM